MNRTLSRILTFVVLALVQVFILNKIHLFGYATPLLYLYFILTLGQDVSRNKLMLSAFALGLVIDVFSNTFGIHAAASTLTAFLRPALIRLFFLRGGDGEPFTPGIHAMGVGAFVRYALLATLLHHTLVFCLEYFSFAYLLPLAISIGGSTLLTLMLVMAIEHVKGK
ncbi:MAG: rod shape-determining protein MreD [Bacteroidaceae bacterium]|nr:rod shape-determining protein MreD [Bacteroidaceae bacterium]